MSIINSKQKIFSNIAALRTLNDGYPKIKKSANSYNSMNNQDEVIEFLIDIVIALIGAEELRNIATDFLSTKLDELEPKIRACIKNTLNEKINLGTNPPIPTYLKTGFDVKIPSIDFYSLLKTDPTSDGGSLLYDDNNSGLASTDCNTFIYETLQDDTTKKWGSRVANKDIVDFKYTNNLFNVKVNDTYASSHTLRDLNNDYIDTIKLYNADKLINKIFDKLFGVVSSTNKTEDELLNEAKLNAVIDKFKNAADNVIIDDSYYSFSNDNIRDLENEAKNRGNGVAILRDCGDYNSHISLETLSAATTPIKNAITFNDLKKTISSGLDSLANAATEGTSDEDKQAAKSWLFKNIIKEMVNALVATVLTPKMIIAFLYNTKVTGDIDPVNFIKENSVIVKTIVCSCKEVLINLLLSIITKEIIGLVKKQATNMAKEAAQNKVLSLLSLAGVPQQALAVIRGL